MKTIIIDGVEYNLTPKVVFHKGDWIVHHGTENVYQVVAVIDTQYQLKYGDNYTIQNCVDVDRCARLWDVAKDAKDGDVLLASDGSIFIFKEVVDFECKHYIALVEEDGTIQVNDNFAHCWKSVTGVCPATKEQRDTLMKAMADAGWEFDFEKKELKLLITNGGDFESEKCEQNSAWSEDDEQMVEDIIEAIDTQYASSDYNEMVNWLLYLKDRYTWKPSDEQIEALDDFIYAKYPNIEKHGKAVKSLYLELKKL